MKQAGELLFEQLFNNRPLFNSQLDLVNRLLSDPNSKYYVNQQDLEKYTKAQSRLKTYISQLLSSSSSRNITEDFKEGMALIIKSRLSGYNEDIDQILDELFQSLKENNINSSKSDVKTPSVNRFEKDFASASYISIITSHPIEADDPDTVDRPPIRKYLFLDLQRKLSDKESVLKFYRFNFPTEPTGLLFWRLLRRILKRYLRNNLTKDLLESFEQRFIINSEICEKYINILDNPIIPYDEITDEILNYLNRNRHIMVFTNPTPIYSIPVIAMDPSETKKFNLYAIIDSEDDSKLHLKEFNEKEKILWRLFVWDPLKYKKYAGQEVKFNIDLI